MREYKELFFALKKMVQKIDSDIALSGYNGDPIQMYLAGGMAVNYYCGTRYTEDVDASFSHHRIILNSQDLIIDYRQKDGSSSAIYFDENYNPSISLMHEDYEEDARSWSEINEGNKYIDVRVLTPIDLAVSKLSRFAGNDPEDIMSLASFKYFSSKQLRERAEEALSYYIGNTIPVKGNIDQICSRIKKGLEPYDKNSEDLLNSFPKNK